jgi:hypothetical protein
MKDLARASAVHLSEEVKRIGKVFSALFSGKWNSVTTAIAFNSSTASASQRPPIARATRAMSCTVLCELFWVPMQNDVVEAIRHGDVHALEQFLLANPAAVTARVDGQRTLLHVATDWPGHFPNVRQTIELLAAQGAELNAPFHGNHSETPLHWASSSDDLVALDALLDLGADIESPGSVIDGGTPLAGAVVFSQWRAARRLIERGARATIWQSAALGMMDRLQQYVTRDPKPSADEITNAFWNACHGGQLEAARYLLCHNAELNWVGHGGLTPLDAAARNGSQGLLEWLRKQEAASSKELE